MRDERPSNHPSNHAMHSLIGGIYRVRKVGIFRKPPCSSLHPGYALPDPRFITALASDSRVSEV